jgi:serine/threonine protein kinase
VSEEVEDPQSAPRKGWGLAEGDPIIPGRIVLGEIGGGWDYEVFLAWDEHLHSLVVVKLVRPHLVHDEHTLRSLAREAELLKRLAHPVIVRGFAAVLEGDRPHLVLEHLEGPTLARTIRREGPLALEQLVPLAFQLASALQYLANEQVVHLDVKPGNVILGAPPRLVDLSVARTVEAAERIRTPVGTDPYMAPEQCDPTLAGIGPATDVYGLGATLYESIASTVPFPRPQHFDREDPGQRFPQLKGDPAPSLSECPSALAEIVSACLSFEPAERPTAGAVAERLEPLIEAIKPRRILGRARPHLR